MSSSDSKNSIELVSCPQGGESCADHLRVINDKLELARELFEYKDFSRGINVLVEAYGVSYSLSEGFCVKCADLFREIIFKSLNKQLNELERLTSGFLKRHKFVPDLRHAENAINKLKNSNKEDS